MIKNISLNKEDNINNNIKDQVMNKKIISMMIKAKLSIKNNQNILKITIKDKRSNRNKKIIKNSSQKWKIKKLIFIRMLMIGQNKKHNYMQR